MKKGTIKPAATIVAQFPANVEIETLSENGKIYLPVFDLSAMGLSSEEPEKRKAEPSVVKDTDESVAKSSKSESTNYTEEQLMEMPTKEIEKILRETYNINPNDFDGKNTNKKLRDLLLDAQDGNLDDKSTDESTDKDEEKSPEQEGDNEITNQIVSILEDFDGGKKNRKKTIQSIMEVLPDIDNTKLDEIMDTFEEDSESPIEDFADEIVASAKPAKKSPKSKESKSKETLVSVEDLNVGDKVSVYWNDDNKAWFDGEVKSIKKGKVLIAYDDDTEEYIDEDIHTKIKLL